MEKILDSFGTRTLIPRSSSQYPVAIPTALTRLLKLKPIKTVQLAVVMQSGHLKIKQSSNLIAARVIFNESNAVMDVGLIVDDLI
jgi:flagellar assembly factor FliW